MIKAGPVGATLQPPSLLLAGIPLIEDLIPSTAVIFQPLDQAHYEPLTEYLGGVPSSQVSTQSKLLRYRFL